MAALISLMGTSTPEVYYLSAMAHAVLDEETSGSCSYLDTGVCRLLHCGQQIIISRIKGHCESAIDDPAIYVDTEVYFHDIARLQNDFLLTGIGSIMRNTIVERKSCWESQPRYQTAALFKARVI